MIFCPAKLRKNHEISKPQIRYVKPAIFFFGNFG